MWFNILKLDLSNLKQNLKPLDTDGKNIKIDDSDKCRKKLINFQNKLVGMRDNDKGIFVDTKNPINLPEHIACQCVEKIDEFFNSITSFSYPVREAVDVYELYGKYEFILNIRYFSQNKTRHPFSSTNSPATVLLIMIGPTEYFARIVLAKKEHSLMRTVKKHWEES